MRNLLSVTLNSKNGSGLAIVLAVALLVVFATPALSEATMQTTITINNNSNWEIGHLYLSPPNSDDWGPDQLNSTILSPGKSFTFTVSCNQAQVKLITEDKDGCFLYKTVDCADNAEWTITNSETPNCGG